MKLKTEVDFTLSEEIRLTVFQNFLLSVTKFIFRFA